MAATTSRSWPGTTPRPRSSGIGGDIGWIAKGQLDDQLTNAIFATPIGKTSEIVTVAGDGTYLFKVSAEETRTPGGSAARGTDLDRLLAVVRREEVGGHDHARRNHHGRSDQLTGGAGARRARRRGAAPLGS